MREFAPTCSIFIRIGLALTVSTSLTSARSVKVDALVIRVDRAENIIIAAHRPIPGYMPAMTMPFRAKDPGDLEGLTAGTRIEFEFETTKAVARGIRKIATADPDLIRPGLGVGAVVPEFALVDQAGRTLKLSDLRGKLVALQFIYTRCPVAEVCPRMAAGFATLQRRFAETSDLVLLSVSLDPRFDTPAVLADYAKLWRARPEMWHFLTGSPEAVEQVAGSFGVVYWPEDGTLTHTARTALIDRKGCIAALVEGSSFRTDQLLELIRHHLEVSR
jgi:protein SCO1/2